MQERTLDKLKIGETAVINNITADGMLGRRLTDIGLITDIKVKCIGKSIAGDPKAYLICGSVIAIRADDAKSVSLY